MSKLICTEDLDNGEVAVGTKLELVEDTTEYNDNTFILGDIVFYVGKGDTNYALLSTKDLADVTEELWFGPKSLERKYGGASDYAYVGQIFKIIGEENDN